MPCNIRITRKAAQQQCHYNSPQYCRNTLQLKVSLVLREPLLHSCQEDRLLHVPAKVTPTSRQQLREPDCSKHFCMSYINLRTAHHSSVEVSISAGCHTQGLARLWQEGVFPPPLAPPCYPDEIFSSSGPSINNPWLPWAPEVRTLPPQIKNCLSV